MDLRACAIADNGAYLAMGTGGRCCLFTIEAGPHVELGDLLRSKFEPPNAPHHLAHNLTRGKDVLVRVEHWAPAPSPAIGFLLHRMLPPPRVILTASRRLLASAADAAHHLCDQMAAARA
jgi:hypothetical protein